MAFPNLHLTVLFHAESCSPIVAEIQIHHEKILQIAKQDPAILFEVAQVHTAKGSYGSALELLARRGERWHAEWLATGAPARPRAARRAPRARGPG